MTRRAAARGRGVSVEALETRVLLTTISIDYSLDTNNFFDTQEKMDLLQSAADNLAGRLTDNLLEITGGGTGPNNWSAQFSHPGTGTGHSISNPEIPEGTMVVYAGGRVLGGSTTGFASTGFSVSGTASFLDLVVARGQTGARDTPATDFGPWGGSVTFDTSTNWHFGLTTTGLENDETDFLSVAEHEIAHLLGIGGSDSWDDQISAGTFTGTESVAEFGSAVPLNAGNSHWASGTMSDGRPANMTPSLLNGTRGLFTALDFAALSDVGWDVSPVSQAESVTLPSGGGNYEVLRDGDDLVLRIAGGAEQFRSAASLVNSLTVSGSADVDHVVVLDSGISVDTPLVFSGGGGDDSFDASLATGNVNLTGNSGSDTLIGGSGDDTLTGGSQADELVGGPGTDSLNGTGGTGDTLDGGEGDDTLNGGSGNDVIREMFTGDVTLTNSSMSGRGNDTVISAERALLSGGAAAQTIDVSAFFTAGLTSVTLNGAGGNDVLLGSAGSDVLVGSGGSDRIEGNAGGDRIIGGAGSDTLIGGAGDDRLKGLGGSGDRLSGGEGDDTLNGGRGVDRVIESGDVDFTLTNSSLTGLGADVVQAIEVAELSGGASANTIDVSAFLGFRGFTLVRGNGGDDSIIGSAGIDVLNGGDGDDSLVGNDGNDLLNGDGGNDILLGKAGNDTVNGGDGHDGLSGFTGDDELNGERGFDRAYGGQGNDTLTGGNAVDTLIGGDGDDDIRGNDGTDTLVGGTGNDDASPGDVITDATANIDEAFTLDPLPAWVDQV